MQSQSDFINPLPTDATTAPPAKTRAEEAYGFLVQECRTMSQLATITDGVSDFQCFLDFAVADLGDLGVNAEAALEALREHVSTLAVDDWVHDADALLCAFVTAIDEDAKADGAALKDVERE